MPLNSSSHYFFISFETKNIPPISIINYCRSSSKTVLTQMYKLQKLKDALKWAQD